MNRHIRTSCVQLTKIVQTQAVVVSVSATVAVSVAVAYLQL